jgi:hypothetical protein
MNLQQSPTITVERPGARNESETRLRGRWLLIARVSWVMLTLFLLVLNVVMTPRYDALLQAHCQPSPQCFAIQLTAHDQQLLYQFGLSLGFLAAYQITVSAVTSLVFFALGGLLFWRKSADRMALFCAFMLVLIGGVVPNTLHATLAPLSPAWLVLLDTLYVLAESSFLIFFLLFPNGRFVPRWTRWIAPCVVLYWIYVTLFANGNTDQSSWSSLVFVAFLLCAVGTQVYRYRRVSTSRERQQTRWVVFGFSIGIVGFVLLNYLGNFLLLPALRQSNVLTTTVTDTIIFGFLLLIPISIAIAILRSRLYDIDVVINKTLVYGLLTALLVAIYAGLIIGLQSLLRGIINQNSNIAIVVSTLVIAALFQPLRHRIQNIIDRRFYRRKYDAAKIVAAFSATLRQEVDLDQLREQLLAVVQETMQLAHVSLWLRPPAYHGNHQVPWRANPPVPSEDEARDQR